MSLRTLIHRGVQTERPSASSVCQNKDRIVADSSVSRNVSLIFRVRPSSKVAGRLQQASASERQDNELRSLQESQEVTSYRDGRELARSLTRFSSSFGFFLRDWAG